METQKIIIYLNDSSNAEYKLGPKKWYVIDSQAGKDSYNPSDIIKFETETTESSLCD